MANTMNKKLIEAVKNVPFVAEKEQWVLTLDKEEGSLFYSPNTISAGAELHQVTDEYALYLDKNYQPKGVMIEYYGQNFIKHHKTFQALTSIIFSGKEKIKTINPKSNKNKNETELFKALLEITLIKEAGAKFALV